MSPSDSGEMNSDLLEDDDDPLFPFGPMPTEPLIARDRNQAFRFISYGKGTRCVVTDDYELMVAAGSKQDLKEYAKGWFRAHCGVCRVGLTRGPTPGCQQMMLALVFDFHRHRDNGTDADVEIDVDMDVGFLDAVDYLNDEDVDDEEDVLELLDLDPDYVPGFGPPESESDIEMDEDDDEDSEEVDSEEEEEMAEHCENCGSYTHNLARCDGPTDEGGLLPGCPLCNTTAHDLDACGTLDGPRDHHLIYRIYLRLLLYRRGRAPFRSERMPWTKALLIGQAWGFRSPGPFPWSDEMALRMKLEMEEDPEEHEQYEEEDPVTGSMEAVEEAIGARRVPDPGDIKDWLPPGNESSPIL